MHSLIWFLRAVVRAGHREAESCGRFLPWPQFSFVATPPQDVFASGQLGILRPKYYRRYLVVAFRYLTGAPLSREEAAAFDSRRVAAPASTAQPTPVGQWLAARNGVPGVTAIR